MNDKVYPNFGLALYILYIERALMYAEVLGRERFSVVFAEFNRCRHENIVHGQAYKHIDLLFICTSCTSQHKHVGCTFLQRKNFRLTRNKSKTCIFRIMF